jgi:hypothetical protein
VDGRLAPMPGSVRSLGLANSTLPFFNTSPGQVTISPDDGQLVVSTKGHGTIDVFDLDRTAGPARAGPLAQLRRRLRFVHPLDQEAGGGELLAAGLKAAAASRPPASPAATDRGSSRQ